MAVFVGGRGRNGGFTGGGALKGPDCCRGFGGGASDVRQGGLALVDRDIVAAGGGGAGNAEATMRRGFDRKLETSGTLDSVVFIYRPLQ